jgi:hypothetical protein
MSVLPPLPPVEVNFEALDNDGDEEWKNKLMGDNFDWDEESSSMAFEEPLTEISNEEAPGQAKEDPLVEKASSGIMDWLWGGSSENKDKGKEKVEDSKPPSSAKKRAPAKRPPAKAKTSTVKKPAAKKLPAKRRATPVDPADPEVIAKNRLITKYRSWATRFNDPTDLSAKTVKQLSSMKLEDIQREYNILKAKTNQGASEGMMYDLFENGVKMFGNFYTKFLRKQRLMGIYGDVQFTKLDEVLQEALGEENGDPDLKIALAEAAIELAEWLQVEWYYRLCWCAHKICKEAADAEVLEIRKELATGDVSTRGADVLKALGIEQ